LEQGVEKQAYFLIEEGKAGNHGYQRKLSNKRGKSLRYSKAGRLLGISYSTAKKIFTNFRI
jgi:hypothetical protein